MGSDGTGGLSWGRRRRIHTIATTSSASTKKPPTAPPTIAPMFKGVVRADGGVGLLLAVDLLVDELVVVVMVDGEPVVESADAEWIDVTLVVLVVEACVASQVEFRLSSGAAFSGLSLR